MSETVHVTISVSKGGFLEMCRKQGWLEPFQQNQRMVTCIDPAESALMPSRTHKYVSSQNALWFDDSTGRVGYDGDFTKLKVAADLFVAPECLGKTQQLAQMEERLRAMSRSRQNTQADKDTLFGEIQKLRGEIYASDLVLCCEGLADAKLAGRTAEIVLQDGHYCLDVEVPDSIQEVGMQEVTLS